MTPEEFFADSPLGSAVLARVSDLLRDVGDVRVRATTSQVAFRRHRSFAHLWRPGQYLHRPAADVVLSIVLGRHDPSPRWKEVAHPTPAHWMHHLEVHDLRDIDDEVAGWLVEAALRAGAAH
ncbi:DUF5655 domain-containing protein [Trujillonella endophytica]|uniref:DUF5655 domain-containing protein n=1 Tax=Trujillonella endophytica TaxID=673521 RepID=A0A1H8T0T5_9ACTN|nr:DUF5655 domain-containing protein [Trujillella endophytica]SEO84512.1 hypothetical protein SAMN05660991_01978 [Trujillella endophytica]